MSARDCRGLVLSNAAPETVELYDQAVARYLDYRLSAMDSLKALLARDPAFVMGHCLQGYFYCLLATNRLVPKIDAVLARIEPALAGVTPREAAHVDALRAWRGGDMARANATWEAITEQHPHDLLALRLLHFNTFWMGNSAWLRDAVARVLPVWEAGMPGYGSLLGMYAFGLEECGDYQAAEYHGRSAVDHNPDDLWAIHAVAHVFEMQGRLRDGLQWLDYPPDAWDDRNPFKGHLWWHRALYAVEAGDGGRALDLYDRLVRPQPSDFYLDIQNATSLLLRLDLAGAATGARWGELADAVEPHIGDHVLAFNEMHSMMALAADGRSGAAGRLLESLRAFAATSDNYAASVTAGTVLPVCEAVLAFYGQDYGRVVELLRPLRYELAGVGGSHAQRDVFTQLLIHAALRAGERTLALALLRERVTLKPNSAPTWNTYARALEEAGNVQAAREAQAHSQAVEAGVVE